jgi:hypothetical protein
LRARLDRRLPSPMRISPTRRPSPTWRPSPTCISSPTRHPLPRRASPQLAAPTGPRPSSMSAGAGAAPELDCGTCMTVPAGHPDRYAAPPPPLGGPLCGRPPACVCPKPAGPCARVWPC